MYEQVQFGAQPLVLIGPTHPFRGGIAHYTTLLCAELRKTYSVELFSYTRQYPRWLFPGQTDRDPSAAPLQVAAHRVLDPLNPLTWLRVGGAIRRLRPAAVILPWTVPYWAPMLGFLAFVIRHFSRARLIFICHNVLPHERHPGDAAVTRLVLSQAHACIVHSESDKTALAALVPGANVRRAALPIYDAFPHPLDRTAARRQLKVDGPVALFFGLIRPYKGLRVLLDALPLVRRSIPLHLLVVGEFWGDREDYERVIAQSELSAHVTIVGRYVPNEEVGVYFAAADLVVLPYESASQSAVVQLAYGYEKPVVSTRVGGLPDAVLDGETGYLVPPRDPQALAEAIVRFFVENRGPVFTAHIREIAPTLFAWHAMVGQIEALIDPSGAEGA